MNTNKPTWNEGDKAGSLRNYAAWLNDNARTMFLEDHAHMEIIFLLGDDGSAQTIPVPVDQDREQILGSVMEQIRQDKSFAVIHIRQMMAFIPDQGDEQSEAVVIAAESRDGNRFMYINKIQETETDLTLLEEKFFDAPPSMDAASFFNNEP